MKKQISTKKKSLILSVAMSSLIMLSIGVSSFAYWTKQEGNFNIPTTGFNATEDEFTYYACIPNVASEYGYDYYDIDSIPVDLTDRVTGLAAVRFEALTKTCYIPSYPKVTIDGKKYNNGGVKELPVIHILNSISYDDISIDNGYSKVETLIIPETVTFIQPGAFATSSELKEVSFLGTTSNSGYICYEEDEFVKGGNPIDLHFESSHRNSDDYLYMLSNKSNYRFTQFSEELEYDNLTGNYYTYVIPNVNIASGSTLLEGIDATSSVDMKANTKYKITFDGKTIKIDEYTYQLSYAGEASNIDLVLNTNVRYEEYILEDNLGTIRIPNYPTIKVYELINGEINNSVESSFELANLNASYSKDNYAFEIKYAPSYTYESTHYYTDSSEELIDVTTLTQISVEKAYFLNQVTSSTLEVSGEKVKTITVPDDNYLGLYVKAKYTNKDGALGAEDVYYVDPKKSAGDATCVEMSKNGDSWTYQYSSNNAPEIVKTAYDKGEGETLRQYLVPNSFVFYPGKHSVIAYPSYVASDTTEQGLQTTLASSSYGTTRVYLDTTLESGLYQDDHYGDDDQILYHWYLIYWDDNGKQGSFRVYFADYESTYLIADVPNIAHHFKFARIPSTSTIDAALANDWSGVMNQTELDGITFKEENANEKIKYLDIENGYNLIKWKEWYGNNNGHFVFTLNKDASYKVTDTKLLLRNRNYLVIDNYGQFGEGTTRFIPIDENLGYDRKDIHTTTNKLEFTKYSDYERRHIQSIALSKGSTIKAKIYNINSADYFDGYFGKSSITGANALGFLVQNSKGQNVPTSDYFEFDSDGYLVVQKDCQVEFYLKVNYNSTSKTIVDYGWYFKVISDTLPGFNREVIVDLETGFTGNNSNYNSSTKTFDMTYPLLTQTGTPIKLERNYANTEYEEYYYHADDPESIDENNYVVSPYYEANRNFGANTGSTYYSIISNTPTGETNVPNNHDLILFTPNEEGGYETRYFAVFDEYDNLLTYLSYNQTQSINEGYQCFSFVVPQALNDYNQIYIYEVDKNGNFIYQEDKNGNVIRDSKAEGPLNSETNFDQIRIMYNNINNTSIQYEKNDLIYDYFLQIEDQIDFNSNNLGFSFSEKDGDYNVYYFDDMYIDSSKAHQLYGKTIGNVALSNVTSPLDEQIIDGYYYTGLTLGNGSKSFTLPDGYYDFCLRVKDNGNCYLGYRYLGDITPYEESYTLHLYENGVKVDVISMNATYNKNNYFADVVVSKNYTFNIYDSVNMLVTGSEGTLTYSKEGINVARIYFSNNYPYVINQSTSKVLVQDMPGIELIYNFGDHPTQYQGQNVNIRYSPVIYAPTGDSFVNKVVVKNITTPNLNILDGEGNVVYSQYFETITEVRYGSYIVVTEFNTTVQIKRGNLERTINIPQPGKYYIYFYEGTAKSPEVITCTKVQETDRFYVMLNEQEIASLDVNPSNSSYYEYYVKNHVILYEEIVLTGQDADVLLVKDYLGNVASSIERVTLDGTSVTTIPAGVYSLTYSVDSSRRVGDNYLVFTYFNFVSIDSSTITYHYETSLGVSASTVKKAVTTNQEITWDYTLETYQSLTTYVPQGKYFAGWTLTEGSKNVDYDDGEVINVESDINLYPVFKDRSEKHTTIWLSDLIFDSTSDIIFTLSGLENSEIVEVTHETISTTNYIDVVDNRVFVNPSLFERIGYVEGGIPLLVHLQSTIDGAEYSTVVKIPYPRYESGQNSTTTFSTSFTTSEYPINKADQAYTKTIVGLNDNVINWDVEDANMTTYQSKDGGEDMALRIKAGSAGSIIGKVTTDTLFTKIADITFEMYTQEYFEDTTLEVVLLDASRNELYRSEPLQNSVDDIYESKTVSIDVEGVYFIRFEASTISTHNTFVHVDNVAFKQGMKEYRTSFTKDEYVANAGSSYSASGQIVGTTNSYPTWNTVWSRTQTSTVFSTDNVNDMSIAIKREGDDKDNHGYIQSSVKFTNVANVSLYNYVGNANYTFIKIQVSIVDDVGNIIYSSELKGVNTQSVWEELSFDLPSVQTGFVRVGIAFSKDVSGNSTDYICYIDELVITCANS